MELKYRYRGNYHLVVETDPNVDCIKKMIPTAIQSETYIMIDFSSFEDDPEERAVIEKQLDEYLYPGQEVLCPIVLFGFQRMSYTNMHEMAKRIRSYVNSVSGSRPQIVVILAGSGLYKTIKEMFDLPALSTRTYDTDGMLQPCITTSAMEQLQEGVPVECEFTEQALAKYKDHDVCKDGNSLLCINACLHGNLAVVTSKRGLCRNEWNEITTGLDTPCLTVKVTDLIF